MSVLIIIWVLGAQERVETLTIEACPTAAQVQAYAASNAMRRDWTISKWSCEVAQ